MSAALTGYGISSELKAAKAAATEVSTVGEEVKQAANEVKQVTSEVNSASSEVKQAASDASTAVKAAETTENAVAQNAATAENTVAKSAGTVENATAQNAATAQSAKNVEDATAQGAQAAENAAKVEQLDPAELRFSQNTAGGKGRADILRQSMGEKGWAGDPVDAVRTSDGVATIDNTRVAVARELGMDKIPVRVHAPNEPLPPDMIKSGRFGDAKTWGEALTQRTANQRPPLPATGTPNAPRMPGPQSQ